MDRSSDRPALPSTKVTTSCNHKTCYTLCTLWQKVTGAVGQQSVLAISVSWLEHGDSLGARKCFHNFTFWPKHTLDYPKGPHCITWVCFMRQSNYLSTMLHWYNGKQWWDLWKGRGSSRTGAHTHQGNLKPTHRRWQKIY